jgi:hypothetical protein
MKDYKYLAEMIYKRKSVREYSKKPSEILENNINMLEAFEIHHLIDSIKVKVAVLRKSGVRNERSDYCLAFYSEEKPLHLENIGFIGQQISLELFSKGLGTCWWGMKKPKNNFKSADGLDCIITMTAGYPQNAETRVHPDDFDRKTARDIVVGDAASDPDTLIEAVRIAPSAINLQPWLIEKIDNRYNFYIRKPKSIMEKMIPAMRHIDMGIAMAHLFVQAKADGHNVSFGFEGKDIKQGAYIGTVYVN